MTRIKICGVRKPEHALVAAEAGADFIGVIFAPMSSRQVTPEQARDVGVALRGRYPQGPRPLLVGVFVNERPEVMKRVADLCGLDLLQLSGDEPWRLCSDLSRPVIKALRVPEDQDPGDLAAELDRELPNVLLGGGHCLLESHVAGRFGGTGQRLNWTLGSAMAQRFPFLLSGGLSPENIGEALHQVHPWGIDVSSGVETNGAKDPEKIRSFIHAVKSYDSALATRETG